MATFVLVIGAWHGGWAWKRVAPLLRTAGHTVFTPTLTGLADRQHLASDDVDLTTHVTDVVNLVDYEDLSDIVLVGHSYSGFVITGVAAERADKISHLIFLDAFIPNKDGETFVQNVGPVAEAMVSGPDWRVAVPDPPVGDFDVTDAADLAWIKAKMTPHPRGTMTEGVKVTVPIEALAFKRTYVRTSDSPFFLEAASRVKDRPEWQYRELLAGHDSMVTQPDDLTKLLLALA
ncbi:MAG TPA: alpha/beta hydrolase [Dehalococcoidia bacterium]|nr:alpha/beta hydrolase [Dehalococcoidia bacterium]